MNNHENLASQMNLEKQSSEGNASRQILWKASSMYDGYEYSLSKAQYSEIDDVCEVVNAEEILEAWHLFRMPIHDALQKTIEYSMFLENLDKENLDEEIPHEGTLKERWGSYSLYRKSAYKEEIIGMGGVIPLAGTGNIVGEVWCIGADMKDNSRFLSRHGKEMLAMFFEKCPVLVNVVGTWNKRNIRWLQHVGFFVEKTPQYMGMNKSLFHKFYMTKQMFEKKYHFDVKVKREKICAYQPQ